MQEVIFGTDIPTKNTSDTLSIILYKGLSCIIKDPEDKRR